MKASNDKKLVTVPEIAEQFGVSVATVRSWILSGRLVAVRREGLGRGGTMYFARGEVVAMVYGMCLVCGSGFKRATIRQRFCSTLCRQRYARVQSRAT